MILEICPEFLDVIFYYTLLVDIEATSLSLEDAKTTFLILVDQILANFVASLHPVRLFDHGGKVWSVREVVTIIVPVEMYVYLCYVNWQELFFGYP